MQKQHGIHQFLSAFILLRKRGACEFGHARVNEKIRYSFEDVLLDVWNSQLYITFLALSKVIKLCRGFDWKISIGGSGFDTEISFILGPHDVPGMTSPCQTTSWVLAGSVGLLNYDGQVETGGSLMVLALWFHLGFDVMKFICQTTLSFLSGSLGFLLCDGQVDIGGSRWSNVWGPSEGSQWVVCMCCADVE